jgi:hypothetical protein
VPGGGGGGGDSLYASEETVCPIQAEGRRQPLERGST